MKKLFKNKKALLPVLGFGTILMFLLVIGGITSIAFFFFSSTIRLIIIGMGLIGLAVFLILGSGTLSQSILGDNIFVKPQFARLECAPTDAYEKSVIKWLDQQLLFNCDANTEECRFTVDQTNKQGLLSGNVAYAICDLSGTSCSGKISTDINSFS